MRLDRDLGELERRYARQARLASASDGLTPERAWREASLAALRAQSDLADLTDRHVPASDTRVKDAQARLSAAKSAESRAADVALRRPRQGEDESASAGDPRHEAAVTSASIRVLHTRRAAREREVEQLRQTAAATVRPTIDHEHGGVWTDPVHDRRKLFALGAAVVAGTAVAVSTRR